MKPGDLVQYICKEPREVGVVIRVYPPPLPDDSPDIFSIDVMWDDGIWTHDADDCEIISADR